MDAGLNFFDTAGERASGGGSIGMMPRQTQQVGAGWRSVQVGSRVRHCRRILGHGNCLERGLLELAVLGGCFCTGLVEMVEVHEGDQNVREKAEARG